MTDDGGEVQPEVRRYTRRTALRHLGLAAAVVGVRPLLPVGLGEADPETLTERLDGLPLQDGAARGALSGPMSEPLRTPIAFSMLGFRFPSGADEVELRTSVDGSEWSPWHTATRIPTTEGPDSTSSEDTDDWRRMSNPLWVGEARWLQVRGVDPRNLRVDLIDSAGLHRGTIARTRDAVLEALAGPPSAAHAAAPQPRVYRRSEWGANESWAGSPSYASNVRFSVVHHTVTGNDYASSEVPGIIRGIYRYHTQSLGWKDIGYNFIVDKYGRVWEGRKGGIDRAVIGAHAAGYNSGSTGVACLGWFHPGGPGSTWPWRSMLDGADAIVAWKFTIHGVEPMGTTTANSRTIPTIVGHRNVGSTACPGDHLYTYIRGSTEWMRDRVAVLMTQFKDVSTSSTFYNDIMWLAAAGITKGCNPPTNDRFCPKDVVTREQMAAFLVRALGLTNDSHPGFKDVPAGSTFDRDIRRLARAGITQGCNPPANDRFCPKDAVTREQMAAFMVRAFGLKDDSHPGFKDVQSGSTFDRDIRRLAKAGITKGCNPPANDRFCPKGAVTREQMAAFLHRAVGKSGTSASSTSEGAILPVGATPTATMSCSV